PRFGAGPKNRTRRAAKSFVTACYIGLCQESLADPRQQIEWWSRVPFVIVGHRSAPTLFERQAGLGTVQRLHLARFVDTKHDGFVGRFIYSPTTSVSFSRNFGSRDSLNVFVRCGWMLWLRHRLLIVDLLIPPERP